MCIWIQIVWDQGCNCLCGELCDDSFEREIFEDIIQVGDFQCFDVDLFYFIEFDMCIFIVKFWKIEI